MGFLNGRGASAVVLAVVWNISIRMHFITQGLRFLRKGYGFWGGNNIGDKA